MYSNHRLDCGSWCLESRGSNWSYDIRISLHILFSFYSSSSSMSVSLSLSLSCSPSFSFTGYSSLFVLVPFVIVQDYSFGMLRFHILFFVMSRTFYSRVLDNLMKSIIIFIWVGYGGVSSSSSSSSTFS